MDFNKMLRLLFLFLGMLFSFHTLYANAQLPLDHFLQTSKEKFQMTLLHDDTVIHFVMGNESADMDSVVSSIAYAYLLNSQEEGMYLPLLNLYREELALRKDIQFLMEFLHICPENIICLNDVSLDSLYAQNRLRLNLVDHNLLRPRQEHLSNVVERIVDHHADENKSYPLLITENKLIAVTGSATTLIAEKIFSNSLMALTPELASFLLAPILLDTANLQSVEKTTERDIQAAKILSSAASLSEDFYEKLLEAKNDISGLTPAMLLSKDFKEYLDGKLLYGIASLPPTICWGEKDLNSLQSILNKYAEDRDLSFLIVLMANDNPEEPKRKILVHSPSRNLLKAFDQYIREDEVLSGILLACAQKQCCSNTKFYLADYIARKQLQPLFNFSQNARLMHTFEKEAEK